MELFECIKSKKTKIAVIGLGYVGLPLAAAFSKKADVIGFDINSKRIELYKNGKDPTNELGEEGMAECRAEFTGDAERLLEASFFIVAVPTPINSDKTPDLTPVIKASKTVAKYLRPGCIVVYESTVYPGVTEEICLPILEKESGLSCPGDFQIGYSPERINPGDHVHRLATMIKVVSGIDEATLDTVAAVYSMIIEAGVYRADSIRIAEAAKAVENAQRDVNIAFVNELAMLFNRMDIDTKKVLEAASTKWNFLKFQPGLVGGHCIGVDPYYLNYKAESEAFHTRMILTARQINDDMGGFVARNIIKLLVRSGADMKKNRVGLFGFAYKEDCPDTRNTKVDDIIKKLLEYGIEPLVYDPVADKVAAWDEYGVRICGIEEMKNINVFVVAVGHKEFTGMTVKDFAKMAAAKNKRFMVDVKGIYDRSAYEKAGWEYWRL